jgi:hypothetical protein
MKHDRLPFRNDRLCASSPLKPVCVMSEKKRVRPESLIQSSLHADANLSAKLSHHTPRPHCVDIDDLLTPTILPKTAKDLKVLLSKKMGQRFTLRGKLLNPRII